MRRAFLHLLLGVLALSFAAVAQAKEVGWGRVYTASGQVTVRENPEDGALTVRVLKSGQKVRVDFVEDGWAAVFDPAETVRAETRAQGYVRLSELRTGARPEPVLLAAAPDKPEKTAKPEKVAKPEKSAKPDKGVQNAPKKAAPTGDFGEIRVADRRMAIRAGRDKDTDFVRLLQPGRRVRVDFHEDGWFAIFDPDEKVRDLKRAWGFGRDKYLVPEKDYAGQPLPDSAPAASEVSAKPADKPAPKTAAKDTPEAPAQKQKHGAQDSDAVGYAVLGRQTDSLRPLAPVVLRVRLEAATPPAPEALRKIVREIWKAERRKGEDLQVEVLLQGMDKAGLAYAVGRFHEDGRLREFWWRDVVLQPKR
jgi:hypothetical protein